MRKIIAATCTAALLLAAPAEVLAQGASFPQTPPTATLAPAAKPVRAFYDALLDSMKHAKELGVMGRYRKLEPAVDAAFDFPAMTQLMVGPTWANMSQAERDRLVRGVRRMTVAGYAQSFDGYNGENFVVSPTVLERGGDSIVSTEMVAPEREDTSFVYRMHNSGGTWKIVDIYLDGSISQVAFRRSDFASTLRSGGAGALAQKLDAIADKMLGDVP